MNTADINVGFNHAGLGYNSPLFQNQIADARAAVQEQLEKAAGDGFETVSTTGTGIVQNGDTGTRALREQYLDDLLREVSFKDNQAALIKAIGRKSVESVLVEYTTFNAYGGAGDGFTGEAGFNGQGDVQSADDVFVRETQAIKYLATARNISIAAQRTKSVADPVRQQMIGATRELLGKANLASYFGNAGLSNNSYNGIIPQLQSWVGRHPEDQVIMYDAQGAAVLTPALLNAIKEENNKQYGEADLLVQSSTGYGDSNTTLFGNLRDSFGGSTGVAGGDWGKFMSSFGLVERMYDPMLRPNRPLSPDGANSTGNARVVATADPSSLTFATTPFVATGSGGAGVPVAISPGSGAWYKNTTLNTDSTVLTTVPSLPSGRGNQTNNLVAGTYYIAVAPVYNGREGAAWVYGNASAPGVVGTPTGVVVTAGQVIKIPITYAAITGLGSTYGLANVYFRVYISSAVPASLADMTYLMDIGCATDATGTFGYHNGMFIPGADNALLLDRQYLTLCEFMPLVKRDLPHTATVDRFAMLWYCTPLVYAPKKQIWIRNIKRAALV
jgi:hypothetical protein